MVCSLTRLRAAVKSGPPFVLFTLFILALALSTLFLGLFIKKSSGPLKNPDIISWDSLLNSLSHLDYCLIPSNASATHAFQPQKGISLSLPMSVVSLEGSKDTKPLVGGGLISGTIPLKSLRSNALSSYQNSQIPINFHISSNKKEELNCISIYGPSHLLRDLQRLSLTSKETQCQKHELIKCLYL
ncbi:unnamed protein product [Lepeophtheirus salmonis]|uniref:(salmon louse) hypothetical protein n=1 Tax=Lepeophtheirus salmonis TaxID=72036 RepID=A0A7R8CYK7_LEPSM|nr:unnamed protein product [Lepeophtheirus salmonis]CAF2970132.1 unnamed protein product [Lepeophtheirus salmonis]